MSRETASRCAACPVPPASPCHGPCVWASSGDPFLVQSVVDRAAMPPPGAPAPARHAGEPGDPPAVTPASPKFEPVTREQVARINACPDRDCGGPSARVLTATHYNRPDVVRRHLKALSECRGVADWLYLPHAEPGDEEVLALLRGADFCETRVTFNPGRLGVKRNTAAALDHGFTLADYVVHVEEDVLLGPDALDYFLWAQGRYAADRSVLSVTAYNRAPAPHAADLHRVARRRWYHPWGVALWKDRWLAARGGLLASPGENGWDLALHEYGQKHGLTEVYPLLSRSQNVGSVSSVHPASWFTPEWHAANHHVPAWSGASPPPPGVWAESDARDVTLRGYMLGHNGYGQLLGRCGRELGARGVAVGYDPLQQNHAFFGEHPWADGRPLGATPPGGWVVQFAAPDVPPPHGCPAVAFTMWEASGLNARQVANLNRFRVVVVPCRWNADGFRRSGVTTPIHVVPLGVDAEDGFAPTTGSSPTGRPFTVGMAAKLAHGGVRKGISEGLAAFLAAFPGRDDVRLEIKVSPDCVVAAPGDARVAVLACDMTGPEMAAWYHGLDLLLVPSKGEGWGLHTLQSMACGVPVAAAKYSGTAEFFDAACGWELPYDEVPAGGVYEGTGVWCVPTEEGMVAALREASTDPAGCRRKGELAATRAAEFTWGRTGDGLAAVLRGVGAVPPAAPKYEPVTRGQLAQISACEFRVPASCGCTLPECKSGKGNHWNLVTLEDCRECLRGASRTE